MKPFRIVFLYLIFLGLHPANFAQSVTSQEEKVKYVFLFIGDGMGLAQVNATEAYRAAVQGKTGLERLTFTQFPQVGTVSTYSNNELITCSAAAGTALATGNKTNNGILGMDPTGKVPYESIAIKAKKAGYKVGIVTTVSIDHATPAAFYAHQLERDMYFEIGMELPKSQFEFFAGGGFIKPDGIFQGRPVNLLQLAQSNGYQLINTREGFEQLKPGSGKALVFSPRSESENSLPFSIDMNPGDITLAEFTEKAIEMLDNERGFFLMVEGGKIDWAGHSNDAATVIHEVIAFDEAIRIAVEFNRQHPDETLIIVTADHETGGMSLGHNDTRYEFNPQLLKYQKTSEEAMSFIVQDFRANRTSDTTADFSRMLKVLENEMGLNSRINGTLLDSTETVVLKELFVGSVYKAQETDGTYGGYDPFISEAVGLLNEKAGISWGTGAHTGINVPIFTSGTGAEKFTGYLDNTDIPKFIGELMGVW